MSRFYQNQPPWAIPACGLEQRARPLVHGGIRCKKLSIISIFNEPHDRARGSRKGPSPMARTSLFAGDARAFCRRGMVLPGAEESTAGRRRGKPQFHCAIEDGPDRPVAERTAGRCRSADGEPLLVRGARTMDFGQPLWSRTDSHIVPV